MALSKSDFLRPFVIGFAVGTVIVVLQFAGQLSGTFV